MRKIFLCLMLAVIIACSFTSCDPSSHQNQFGTSEKMLQELHNLEDILNRENEETTTDGN